MTENTPDPDAFFDELCREIGRSVLNFAPMLERLGWEKAVSARRYLHPTNPATGIFVDFLDVSCGFSGAAEARQRLLEVARAWGLHEVDAAA